MNLKSDNRITSDFMPYLVTFYRKLKGSGIKVSLQQEIDAYRSLEHIDVFDFTDFYHALRTNLIAHQKDMQPFDTIFYAYWAHLQPPGQDKRDLAGDDPLGQSSDSEQRSMDSGEKKRADTPRTGEPEFDAEKEIIDAHRKPFPDPDGEDDSEPDEMPLYCSDEKLRKKDFSTFIDEDLEEIEKAINFIAEKIRIRLGRKKRRDALDRFFDFRRTLRKNIRHGGGIFNLAWKARKREKTRLVLLCDISGSMETYSRFLILFLYGLQKHIYNMETFVFSTRLSRVTAILRSREYHNALARISRSVHDWSGGTKIGDCLAVFNRRYASTVLYGRTVVVVISDGWDCGQKEQLREEMARLRKYAYHLIWLNPLLANPEYEPICMGMQTALPFLDQFLPLYNLESLVKLGGALAKIG